ncbi:MAG: SDR family oxidoreductase, partial [Burkholderiales bacterium]|nr:SDR family oxidoreductase [Burkholderiales bacterium]
TAACQLESRSAKMKSKVSERLEGQVALVSGATGGMGSAICKRLAMAGMRVIMLGRDEHKLTQSKHALGCAVQDAVLTHVVNIADPDSVRTAVDKISQRFSKIDLLVHAAGDGPVAALLETSESMWQQSVQGKLMGTVRLTHAVAQEMCRYQEGHIVIVNGVFSKEPDPLFPINSTINCALAGFAKSAARDLGRQGVRINVVNPGATQTPLWDEIAGAIGTRFDIPPEAVTEQVIGKIPLGRLATPTDVANVVTMLASPSCAYLNGVTVNVDGGATAAL